MLMDQFLVGNEVCLFHLFARLDSHEAAGGAEHQADGGYPLPGRLAGDGSENRDRGRSHQQRDREVDDGGVHDLESHCRLQVTRCAS